MGKREQKIYDGEDFGYPQKFSDEWWHIYLFHKTLKAVKRAVWLDIHRLPIFLIQRWQVQELRKLLRQSYEHVPLYRRLLEEIPVRPEEICSYDDIQKLPITSKKLFRSYPPEDFINNSFPSRSYKWTETSGSTGEPFRFPLNRGFYFFKKYYCGVPDCIWYKIPDKPLNADPYVDRFLLWRGMRFEYISSKLKFADIRTVNRPRGKYFLHIPVSDLRENPGSVVEKLKEFRPDVLSGRATTMIELSRIIEDSGETEFRVPFITSVGEMLTETQRKYLEGFFGCEVYERYGAEELGDVAMECHHHRGMHIHEESQIVEILDEENRRLPPGVKGRVVVTCLCNYSVPFIRYDTGDLGEILSGDCPCGIAARRLKIHGRIGAYLELGGKRYQFPEFALLINNFSDFVLRSQIVKVAEDKVEFRFIPSRSVSNEEIEQIKNSFVNLLGITPVVKIVQEIPFSPSGKTQFLIDES